MDYTRLVLTTEHGICAEHYQPTQQQQHTSILFVHGICHGSWVWWNFMGFFASHGYRCSAINLRGHFLSSGHAALGRASVDDYVTDVLSFLSFLTPPVILVGHSMGGIVCQKVAETIHLHKLILLDSAPCLHVTENYLNIPSERTALSRAAFIAFPDNTIVMHPDPDSIKKLLFEKNKVSEETLMQTVSLLGRESAQVAAQHGFVSITPTAITCPVYVLGRTGLGNNLNLNVQDALADYLNASDRCIRNDISHNMMCELDWQEHAVRIERWCCE